MQELTGTAEGDSTGIETGGDGRWRLNVKDEEMAVGGSELDVTDGPIEGVHALFAAVYCYYHASQVSRRHRFTLLLCIAVSEISGCQLTTTKCCCVYLSPV